MKIKQEGQALLIVVLVMVVVLTVGLSVASRSIVNLRLSSEEQQSQKAFSAAEAGIELALKGATPLPDQTLGDNAIIQEVRVNPISGNSFLLNGGNPVLKDEGIDVWVSDYPNYANPKKFQFLTIYWGDPSESCPNSAAIEVIVISGPTTAPLSTRFAFDSCSRTNNFSSADSGSYSIAEKTFKHKTTRTGPNNFEALIKNINDILIIRVVPLYLNTPIAINTCNPSDQSNGCTPLLSQGKQIESIGKSGDTTRKVTLFQGYPSLPSEFFNHVLFCAGGSGSCVMQ